MKGVVTISWDETPHLDPKTRAEFLVNIPPDLVRARTQGVPYLGVGQIYAGVVPVEHIAIDPIPIPNHWKRCFALDVGWNRTAALWAAWDEKSDKVYFYDEHYGAKEEPDLHAAAILGKGSYSAYAGDSNMGIYRGPWIPGVIDPAARGRSQLDGKRLVEVYRKLGMDLEYADNSVTAGITAMWQRLSTGRLKVFRTLTHFFAEYRLYRRDKNHKIVKVNDHLMDDGRYILLSGLDRAIAAPLNALNPAGRTIESGFFIPSSSWMGA